MPGEAYNPLCGCLGRISDGLNFRLPMVYNGGSICSWRKLRTVMRWPLQEQRMPFNFNSLALSLPGGSEWIVIALIGLLLFGKRLPEVGKSLGKSIVEFKKGLRGVER